MTHSNAYAIDAIEKVVKRSIGMLGEFIIQKQLTKLRAANGTLDKRDVQKLIDLVMKEVSPLTGPQKAKELERQLRELTASAGPYPNGFSNSNNHGPYPLQNS